MMTIRPRTLLALCGLITAAAVQAQPMMQGGILTDAAGRTLYTFDKDQPNKSSCQGPCAQNWPAYTAEPAAGAKPAPEASRFEREGAQQWAWTGKPLYYFAGDTKPGDRNGDGRNGVWHIVQPMAAASSTSPAGKAPASTY